jgi:hypothetical protein
MNNGAGITTRILTVLPLLQMAVAVGDFIQFADSSLPASNIFLGEVIDIGRNNMLQVKKFLPITSVLMRQNFSSSIECHNLSFGLSRQNTRSLPG